MPTFPISRLPAQVIDSREMLGCDYGGEARVLAISGLTRLVWAKATRAPYGMRGIGSTTQAATLEMRVFRSRSDGGVDRHYGTEIIIGGRLSKARLAEHRREIDEVLGSGATAVLDQKATMLFGPDLVGEYLEMLRARRGPVDTRALDFVEKARVAVATKADSGVAR